VILVVGVATAVLIALPSRLVRGRLALVGLTLAFAALLAGPAAYAYDTMGSALSGGDPSAGPTVPGSEAFGGGRVGPFGSVSVGGPGGATVGGPGGAGLGGPGGAGVDQAVLDYLVANRGDATWIVAVSGSESAAPIQLATGLPVMTMGGFNGGDASPTLAEFQAYMANGDVRFLISGGGDGGGGMPGGGMPGGGMPGGGMPGGPSGNSEITSWATSNCTAITVGGTTIYDCATSGS